MKLEDLFLIISDSAVLYVLNADDDSIVAVYDGKDSVPERYNSCMIKEGSLRAVSDVSMEVSILL